MDGNAETVTITHWRAVNADGGIAFSLSSRDDATRRARERVEDFCNRHPQYHLEEWEQSFTVSPSEWKQVSS